MLWGGSKDAPFALFHMKIDGSDRYLGFETQGVEMRMDDGWRQIMTTGRWHNIQCPGWTPGSEATWVVGWPQEIPRDAVWRLRIGYRQELKGWKTRINRELAHRTGKELFSFDRTMSDTIMSPLVFPSSHPSHDPVRDSPN
jgi:hypothetical protein